ncbi:hypothetical protein PWT90_08428 [Aphanocladium album]|nr:hypothetical protein PWT90_08428 [Aphanocladium album]
MLCLPDELILAVAGCFDSTRDLNVLAQVNQRLLRCLEPLLYTWPGSDSMLPWADGDDRPLPLPKKALEWGVEWGRDDVVAKALEFDTDGVDLVLRKAFANDSIEVWSLLLPVYSVEKYGTTTLEKCLTEAAYFGRKHIAEALLQSGKLDCGDMKARKVSPLWMAAAGTNFETFEFLMKSRKFELDEQDKMGRTPLSYAVGVGAEAIVWLLLDTGEVDIDARDRQQETPFIHALSGGYPEIATMILGAGNVDLEIRTTHGFSPLMYAAMLGDEALVQRLLDTGEDDFNARDVENNSVLHYAAMRENTEVAKLLLGVADIDINARDRDGWTALTHAAASGNVELVDAIVATGRADIDTRDSQGETALFHAVMIHWTHAPGYRKNYKQNGFAQTDAKLTRTLNSGDRATTTARRVVLKTSGIKILQLLSVVTPITAVIVRRKGGGWDGAGPYSASGFVLVPAYDLSRQPSEQPGQRPSWEMMQKLRYNATDRDISHASILIDPAHPEDPEDHITNHALDAWGLCSFALQGPVRNSTARVASNCSETLSSDCIRMIKKAGTSCDGFSDEEANAYAFRTHSFSSVGSGRGVQYDASRGGSFASGGVTSDNLGIEDYYEEIRTLKDALRGKVADNTGGGPQKETSNSKPDNARDGKSGNKSNDSSDGTPADKGKDGNSTGSVTVMSWVAGLVAASLVL